MGIHFTPIRNSQNVVAVGFRKQGVFSKAILQYKVSVEEVKSNITGVWTHSHNSEWIDLDCNDLAMVHKVQLFIDNPVVQSDKNNSTIAELNEDEINTLLKDKILSDKNNNKFDLNQKVDTKLLLSSEIPKNNFNLYLAILNDEITNLQLTYNHKNNRNIRKKKNHLINNKKPSYINLNKGRY